MERIFLPAGISGLAFIAMYITLKFILERRVREKKRLEEIVGTSPVPIREVELSVPIFRRVFKPILKNTARFAVRLLPLFDEEVLTKKLVEAGRPYNLSPREFVALKFLLSGFLGVAIYLGLEITAFPVIQHLALSALGGLGGWLLPDAFLNSLIKKRKENVEKELPEVLDLITVCIEAGLGFDGAMTKVVEKYSGILSEEMSQVLSEVRMGKPRREALRKMAERLDVDDLSSFVSSVIMAEQLGISMGNVMRVQSREVRNKRRQRIQEAVMKAPIKMLIPIAVFIFPSLFIILLGPAVIQLMRVFGR
ncbi:tight adherence protein C [Caldanaerovirga acetigignens]|uniref:Tight adherence protein C n=1 Tax=Caldanaerovirga acetigignens TaxID=447595 RepID=A0A1M7IP47_9FIRM|nr:type II secretion system F family protein [Caldanaerovirga acetigignens]SHM42572.1 tight adherence protein C [Caldanaerovirga acetigignens]